MATARTRADILEEGLHTSSRMTAVFYKMYRSGAKMYLPEDIILLLNKAKIKFIVMGTHGVGAWRSEPRGTQDVDLLIARKDHKKAVRVLSEAFPELEVIDLEVVTRFRDKTLDKVVIDLMKPSQPHLKDAFRHVVKVQDYVAPDLTFALVSKFAAMISLTREDDKKYIDIGDFINMVKHNRDAIDLEKLAALGEKVYPGGGAEIVKLVEDILAGRKLKI